MRHIYIKKNVRNYINKDFGDFAKFIGYSWHFSGMQSKTGKIKITIHFANGKNYFLSHIDIPNRDYLITFDDLVNFLYTPYFGGGAKQLELSALIDRYYIYQSLQNDLNYNLVKTKKVNKV